MTNTNGCIGTSAGKAVTVNPLPVPTITAGGPTTFCLGDSVNLSTSTYNSYLWSNGSTSSTINVSLSGNYVVQVTDSNGCTGVSAPVAVTSTNCNSILNLTFYIEGYYLSSGIMTPVMMNEGYVGAIGTDVDDVIVELHEALNPLSIVATTTTRLHTNGTATCSFPPLSGDYYIVIKHRNAMQTWSKLPVSFALSAVTYNFSNDINKSFGNNMVLVEPGIWGFYSGDINQDENVDLLDYSLLENDISIFASGYFETDINGDGNIDLLDASILEININGFIFSNHP